MRIVIVGAGMAAARLSVGLEGSGHDVTVIGEEPDPPYNRILLSAVLEGVQDPASLAMRIPESVGLRLDSRVVHIHRDQRQVELADRSRIGYDRLVLATGSVPTLPPIRGLVHVDGRLVRRVHAFRALADSRRLAAAVRGCGQTRPPRRAVVVGGGLLGVQVARALTVRGLATEIVECGDHLLGRQIDARAGDFLAGDLKELGTSVRTGARATRLTGAGLVLDDGSQLAADLVVLAAGGRPNTSLARRAGLDVRRGVVIDRHLTTSDERIHAIGDCAQYDHQVTGTVSPAWEQAALLAKLFRGEDVTYDGSRIVARLRATDLDVAVLGTPELADGEVVTVSNPIARSHRKLVVRDGVIVAATLVGDLSEVGLITQHYDRGTVLGPREPGDLLIPSAATSPVVHPDEAEICACAGVTVGQIRACASVEDARVTTRATTGCGGCTVAVRQLVTEGTLA